VILESEWNPGAASWVNDNAALAMVQACERIIR
jgi:hypothetical protein